MLSMLRTISPSRSLVLETFGELPILLHQQHQISNSSIVLGAPKDKDDVFAQQFAANSILDDNGRSPPDFPQRTPTSIKLPVIGRLLESL